MKIKLFNSLILIDIVTVILILAVSFVPSSVFRIILGLPFLLFLPGYTLLAVLFITKENIGDIERLAYSFVLSITIVILIGFGLNFTSYGIRLNTILYSISAFIFIFSTVAYFRRVKYSQFAQESRNTKFDLKKALQTAKKLIWTERMFKLPGWKGSLLNKSLIIILAVSVLVLIGVIAYIVALPRVGEQFTEFYLKGINGSMANYPSDFILNQGKTIRVSYDGGYTFINNNQGKVNIVIVNHENKRISYSVVMKIDGEQVGIVSDWVASADSGDQSDKSIGQPQQDFSVEVNKGETWEHST